VRVCAADLCVVCVALLALLLCLLGDLYCKGERLQLVEIPRKREKDYKEESRGIQVDPQELASKLLSRANTLITKFCGYLEFDFTGSPIHPPPLGALTFVE
jgi:hypothetical protein